jgi:HEAT repeat protein
MGVSQNSDPALPRRVRTLQAVWMTELLMREDLRGREFVPVRDGGVALAGDSLDLALGAFSRGVSHDDPEERLWATRALVWLQDRRVISPLIRALADDEWDVRLTAISGLADIDPLPDWALEPLAGALGDPDTAIRGLAARALSRISSFIAAQALLPALGDRARTVALEAVWGLEKLGGAGYPELGALGPLTVALFQREDPVLAYAAFWALGWLPGGGPARTEFRLSGWGDEVWKIVAR